MEIYIGKWCWALLALFDTGSKKAIFPSVEKVKKFDSEAYSKNF
jgi:hypothetical protein